MTTDTQDFSHLRALAEAAGPERWIAGNDEDSDYFLVGKPAFDDVVTHPVVKLHDERKALYIAAANPATVIALLGKLESLQAEVAKRIGERDAAWAEKEHKEVLLSKMTSERDAALARLAAMEAKNA